MPAAICCLIVPILRALKELRNDKRITVEQAKTMDPDELKAIALEEAAAAAAPADAASAAAAAPAGVAFTDHGPAVSLGAGGRTASNAGGATAQAAVCAAAPMTSGSHYVELTASRLGQFAAAGVVRPTLNAAAGEPAHESADAVMFAHRDGSVWLGGSANEFAGERVAEGDTIGLLLDLSAGSLTLYHQGQLLGPMVGEGLAGPLVWAVDVGGGAELTIDGPKPPPAASTPADAHAAAFAAMDLNGDGIVTEEEVRAVQQAAAMGGGGGGAQEY